MRLLLALLALVVGISAGCSSTSRPSSTTTQAPSSTRAAPFLPSTTTSAGAAAPAPAYGFGVQRSPCSYGLFQGQAALPDPTCTTGATNPAVTQATIDSTICRSGYSSSVRPPESVTYPEKRASMAAYGRSNSTSSYEYDHLVSLEIGGAPNAAGNLWPEPLAGPYGARVKDVLENKLHDLVCSGQLPLAVAQSQEAGNWITAYNRYVGHLG
jgi:hypothetical protein